MLLAADSNPRQAWGESVPLPGVKGECNNRAQAKVGERPDCKHGEQRLCDASSPSAVWVLAGG